MMGATDHKLLPGLGEAVLWELVCALGVPREFVGPARKLNFCFDQRTAVSRARPRITTLLDVRQRGSVVGGDPIAALQVEVEEGAAGLGHEGQALEVLRFEQPKNRLAVALDACALLAAKLVLL